MKKMRLTTPQKTTFKPCFVAALSLSFDGIPTLNLLASVSGGPAHCCNWRELSSAGLRESVCTAGNNRWNDRRLRLNIPPCRAIQHDSNSPACLENAAQAVQEIERFVTMRNSPVSAESCEAAEFSSEIAGDEFQEAGERFSGQRYS
jgi:hypothetical protein